MRMRNLIFNKIKKYETNNSYRSVNRIQIKISK